MLEISVDLYQRWQRDYTIWNCVRSYEFQHGNVENGVDRSHGLGESEYKGVRAGLSDDFKRSEELFGKLPGGSGHMEILFYLFIYLFFLNPIIYSVRAVPDG